MATERLSMHKTREILRQKWVLGRSHREVARSLGVSFGAVGDGREPGEARRDSKATKNPSGCPTRILSGGCTGRAASRRALAIGRCRTSGICTPSADGPGVTLQLLHLEYLEQHPDGYRYSQFCERYRSWLVRQRVTMRQVHRGGEKMFTDYAKIGPVVRQPVSEMEGYVPSRPLVTAIRPPSQDRVFRRAHGRGRSGPPNF